MVTVADDKEEEKGGQTCGWGYHSSCADLCLDALGRKDHAAGQTKMCAWISLGPGLEWGKGTSQQPAEGSPLLIHSGELIAVEAHATYRPKWLVTHPQ